MHTAQLPSFVAEALNSAYAVQVLGGAPLAGGYLHRTFRLDTAAGPRFLKVHDGVAWPQERVQCTLAVQQHLWSQGLPVPQVCRSLAGELTAAFTSRSGAPLTLALTHFASGERRAADELDTDQLQHAGHTLGRMHRCLRELPTRPSARPTNQGVAQKAQALRSAAMRPVHEPIPPPRATRAMRPVHDPMPPPHAAMRDLALEAAEFRLRIVDQSPLDDAAYEASVWQIVHGDYYPANLLFGAAGSVTAVVDFDFAGPRWRGAEIGRAVVEVAVDRSGRFIPDRATPFMQGYLAAFTLETSELQWMFRLWFDNLLDNPYPLDLIGQPAARLPHDFERLARRRHELLLWLHDHLPALNEWALQIAG